MAKEWFVLRVQSNRETDVRDKLEREVKLEDKEDMIPNVLVPTQTVAEIKDGERQQVEKKLFPGYVIIEVETDESGRIPDSIWYLIRETSGVGDFIGAEKPWPISEEEVAELVGEAEEEEETDQPLFTKDLSPSEIKNKKHFIVLDVVEYILKKKNLIDPHYINIFKIDQSVRRLE